MPGLSATSKPEPSDAELSALASARLEAREAVVASRVPESKRRRRPPAETFKLGRYLITDRIASGGMATVYRAKLEGQGGFAREFAIKVIHPHLAAAEGFVDRFLDEARVASRVNHPNVVATIDSDHDRGYHFLVLELVTGVTLRQLINASSSTEIRRLTPGEAARVVCDAARGLHALHTVVDEHGESLDVVHRDLSPHNLMLDLTGRTVLIDLGLAKARGQLGHTQTGVLCGKLPYMSPEQSRMLALDARSDVFSLGSVLFELAVGEAPFGDDHTPNTLEQLRLCDPDRLATKLVAADVPSWLTQILLRTLCRDPDDRYASALALADSLDDAMRRAGIIQSETRQRLAQRTQATRERLGPEQPAEPLPPLIGSSSSGSRRIADPTGPHGIVGGVAMAGTIGPNSSGVESAWQRRLGMLGMATAGALVVLVGLFVFEALGSTRSATAREQPWLPNLSFDANSSEITAEGGEAEIAPQPTRASPKPESAIPATRAVDPSLAEPQPPAEPAVPARKRKSTNTAKRDPLAEFKSNPYD